MSDNTTYRPSPAATQHKQLSTTSSQIALAPASAQGNSRGLVQVRLVATADCFIETGDNPTAVIPSGATVGGFPLIAGTPEYFDMIPGQKIAGITASSTSELYATLMTKLDI